MTYADVHKEIIKGKDSCNLLLGNGFSIAFDDAFRIKEADNAKEATLFSTFIKIEKNDGGIDKIIVDYPKVMFWRVAHKHPESIMMIRDSEARNCLRFLEPYLKRGKVFTTSYDMLLFWALARIDELSANRTDPDIQGLRRIKYNDGFTEERDDGKYWVKSKTQNIFYCHGAMNLEQNGDACCKRKHDMYSIKPVIDSFIECPDHPIPPIVSADKSDEKMKQINGNAYFQDCFKALEDIKGSLVILGLSLTQNDEHIIKAIKKAQVANGLKVYYGFFSDYDRVNAMNELEGKHGINVTGYFDSGTADIWRVSFPAVNSRSSKYEPLRKYLELHGNLNEFTRTFDEISEIVFGLPSSAYHHRPWWSSNEDHVQARAWIKTGYKAIPDFKKGVVKFEKERTR